MSRVLSFSRSLYREDALLATVDAYQALARLELTSRSSNFELTVSDVDPEFADSIYDEVANHALYETVQRARGEAEAG